jgi:hypothetical protein
LLLLHSAVFAQAPRLVKYPLTKISDVDEDFNAERKIEPLDRRVKAYQELQAMRKAQGLTHIGAQYCSAKETRDTCRPRPNPVPGGPAGGPGKPGQNVNGCAWTSVGPTDINGRVTNIAIDPANHQRIFVTTVGGIWRSSDGARRWERVSDDFLATVFASIVVNGTEVVAGGGDPNYGSGGDGIWRSTSNGDPGSWTKLPVTTFDNQTIFRLRVDPANGDIYAAASNGVWLGTHSGGVLTFAQLDSFDADTNDIAIDFTATPRVVYAGVINASASFSRGIWKHAAGSWQQKSGGITTSEIGRVALALAAGSPTTLYAKIARASTGRLFGVFKTTTGGEPPVSGNAWNLLPGAAVLDDGIFPGPSGSGYSWYNSIIEVDPTDANRVYAGGVGIYRATDGATFTSIGGGAEAGWTYVPHADQHAIAFDPTNAKIVWSGNDGGLDVTTDTSAATWRWSDMAHGMVITEFYRMTSQQAMASLRAGGSQDNGTEISFGNRTWYQPGGCDGSTVALDGVDPDTLFGNCNGGLAEFVNPIPSWSGGPTTVPWVSSVTPIDPLVSDPALGAAALAQGAAPVDSHGTRTGPPILLKTTDGRNWAQANVSAPLTTSQDISAIAIAPSASFQTWYMGVSGGGASIWTTGNGGVVWNTSPTGLPGGAPNRIAVDNTNPLRAFAAFGSGVWMTTNGVDWHAINGSGATAYPPSASAQSIVIDPNDAHTLYVATSIGVLRGVVSGSPTDGAWTPMDEGMPDGINVTDIWAGRNSGLLSISTMGHGAFQRDIRPDVACRTQMLLVRDNVYDRGIGPSPSGMPDPEHPIPDPARPGFFKPDDTDAGKVYWWNSADIRIDVPSLDSASNTIPNADNVEFETCPIEMASCPSGLLWDNHPVRSRPAKAYVQVSNQGIDAVTNVRVIALYADATAGLPLLPADFWTTTFPAGSTTCGALTPGSGWNLVDPAHPCQVIPVVNPSVPETALFNWSVSATQAEHTCMMTIVEAADDPLDPSIRTTNEREPWVLVPNNRQIANRNLHVVNVPPSPGGGSGMSGMGMPWPRQLEGPLTLSISTAGMPPKGQIGLLLPPGIKPDLKGITQKSVKLTAADAAEAKRLGLVPNVMWVIPAGATDIRLSGLVKGPAQQGEVGFFWTLGSVPKGSTWRFSALARAAGAPIGGSTFYLRVGQ